MNRRRAGLAAGFLLVMGVLAASAQMPDVRQMSGIPMPVGDLAPGTVVVRVVRDSLTDNVAGQAVELQVGATTLRATTDASGRAQFTGLTAGANVRAAIEAGGRRIQSQSFPIPAAGGVRLVLASAAGTTPPAAAAGAPVTGDVALGGDSRIQVEFDDDSLTVFYLLEFVNSTGSAVSPKEDLTFELPAGAEQPTLLEGSSSQATVRGRRVAVSGPFAPGTTPVQIAFSLAPAGDMRTLVQALPAPWLRVQVIATKLPGLGLASTQFSATNEVPGDSHSFLLGTGPALGAGQPLSVTFSGLPSRSRAGRYAALALGLITLVWGFWMTFSAGGRTAEAARRADLEQRRARLMAELVKLDRQVKGGSADVSRTGKKREELLAQLERVYGELDQQAAPEGEGLPA